MDATMEMSNYLNQKIEFESILLDYIENLNDFDSLINSSEMQKILKDPDEVEIFLRLILNVSNNYHRSLDFFQKIEKIIVFVKSYIKECLSNYDIFNIFQRSKAILLLLIKNEILILDDLIVKLILDNDINYPYNNIYYLYPELKTFLDPKKQEILEKEIDLNYFEENRTKGENESYLCSLIRNDSIVDFIVYCNKNMLSLTKSTIKSSIFETNSFLLDKNPTLIEYASFFGSIQIFQYLILNGVELTHSIWLYSIHGKNAEIIHILEEKNVAPPDDSYEICLEEAIKCHHNDIGIYIEDNLLISSTYSDKIILSITQSCNFSFLFKAATIQQNSWIYYLSKYNFFKIIKLYLKVQKSEFEKEKIQQANYFNCILNLYN